MLVVMEGGKYVDDAGFQVNNFVQKFFVVYDDEFDNLKVCRLVIVEENLMLFKYIFFCCE